MCNHGHARFAVADYAWNVDEDDSTGKTRRFRLHGPRTFAVSPAFAIGLHDLRDQHGRRVHRLVDQMRNDVLMRCDGLLATGGPGLPAAALIENYATGCGELRQLLRERREIAGMQVHMEDSR